MDIKELHDEIKKTFNDFKNQNDQCEAQIKAYGAASATTVANVEALNKKLDELQVKMTARMEDAEKRLNRQGMNGAGEGVDQVRNAAVLAQLTGRAVTAEDYNGYSGAMNAYLRRGESAGGDVKNLMSVGSDPAGGYWVQPERSGMIVQKIIESSPVRQIAGQVTIGTDAYEYGIDAGEAGSGWVGEQDSRPTTGTPTIGLGRIEAFEQYASPDATQKLLDDAAFDVEGWLSGKVADKFTRTENTAFVVGDGVRKPRGFISYDFVSTGDATRKRGKLQYIPTGVSGDFHATTPGDAMIDLVYSLKADYRQGAAWTMQRATVGKVRKLKDDNKNYLWQPGIAAGQPSTLLNFPIAELEDMPAVGADKIAIAFGNFQRGYLIVDRIGIRVLRDPYTKKGFVIFYSTKRVGGDVIDFDAIKGLKFSNS